MVDAQVEGGAQQGALAVQWHAVAEVVPQAQGKGRQHQAAAADAAVGDALVAVGVGEIGQAYSFAGGPQRGRPVNRQIV